MPVDAAALVETLRRLPVLPPPDLSERSQSTLARCVALAMAPASADRAVPDAALAQFLAGSEGAGADRIRAPSARLVPAIGASGDPAMSAVVAPERSAMDWGRRVPPPPFRIPTRELAADGSAPSPPYGAADAAALAGIAAGAVLMRRHGFGAPDEPLALVHLGQAIRAFDQATEATDAPPPDAYAALLGWAGAARQIGFVRDRLGADPADPEQRAALADALDGQARWLSERPRWADRAAAADSLTRWLPLRACADAYERRVRGSGAFRELGQAIRNTAAAPLPPLRDPARTARFLAILDAVAILHATLGIDLASETAAARLRIAAQSLERAPEAPTVDASGALDRSCLDGVRQLDRSQADELAIEGFGDREIPFVASGLPVLAALDAASRIGAVAPFRARSAPGAWRNTPWS